MMLSLFLAKLIGIYLVLVSGTMILNKRDVALLFGIYSKNPGALYITGVVDTLIGLAIVLAHNVWVWDFRVAITLVGWMLLIRGVGRMLAPDMVMKSLGKFKRLGTGFMLSLMVVILFIGLYLAYMGFTA